jgi:myo-inositol catabolism protein IolC
MTNSLTLGYDKPLFILPFDHRSSFEKGMFGVDENSMTDFQRQAIIEEKKIIYEGFKKAVSERIPKGEAAILVDEEFGSEVLLDARVSGFNICLTTEKSGQEEFDFEYGTNFKDHIEKFKPKFVKALIRFNPDDDNQVNQRQSEKLKILSDYCRGQNYLFLLEVLIPPTKEQLAKCNNQLPQYEDNVKPQLTIRTIDALNSFGIGPDVWKLEGMGNRELYEKVALKIREKGENIGIVILGRGEKKESVEKWIIEGAKAKGITGFAIGRTIFWQPILDFKEKKLTKEQAIDIISNNYQYFYNLFIKTRGL